MGRREEIELQDPDNGVDGASATSLSRTEKATADAKTAPRAAILHEAIRKEGEDELRRPASALVWSGLAAGLSMGM